jgi:hypothetical protein
MAGLGKECEHLTFYRNERRTAKAMAPAGKPVAVYRQLHHANVHGGVVMCHLVVLKVVSRSRPVHRSRQRQGVDYKSRAAKTMI